MTPACASFHELEGPNLDC